MDTNMNIFKRMIAAVSVAAVGFAGFAATSPNLPEAKAATAAASHYWFTDELVFVNSKGAVTTYNVGVGQYKLGSKRGTTKWSTSWTTVTAIDVNGDGRDEMLFYNSKTGKYNIRKVNTKGQVTGAAIRKGTWAKGWTSIAAVNFQADANDEIVFYNSKTGKLASYNVGKTGNLGKQLTNRTVAKNWTSVFAYTMAGKYKTDNITFYNSKTGEYAMYGATSKGNLGTKRSQGTWAKGWTSITTGNFGLSKRDDIVFYNSKNGKYQLAQLNTISNPSVMRSGKWSTWKHVVAANVQGTPKPPKITKVPSVGSGSYTTKIKRLLNYYGCSGTTVKINGATLGSSWGVALVDKNTVHIKSGLNNTNLTYVVAHECAHMLQYRAYAGDFSKLMSDMNRIYGGKDLAGLERNADCITKSWKIKVYSYTNSCSGARNKAALAVASGKTA